MNTAKRTDLAIVIVLAAIALAVTLRTAIGSLSPDPVPASTPTGTVSYTDYSGKTIGILTGTNMEAAGFEYFPDSEYVYLDNYPNLNAALEDGIIDAYLGDEPAEKQFCDQFNEFLRTIKAEGKE